MAEQSDKTSLVKSIARAIDILKVLGDGADTLRDICGRLSICKSTGHRALQALEASGSVVHDPVKRRYYLGPLLLRLASNPSVSHQSLVMCALDEMQRLQEISGETVGIQVPIGTLRVFVEELPSRHSLRQSMGKGHFVPLHTGSGGRVLLAELSDSELNRILKYIKFVPSELNTPKDSDALLKEVEKARSLGYAVVNNERVSGGAGISVPVKNYICPVALSIFGPNTRFTDPTIFLEELKKSAENISKNLLEI